MISEMDINTNRLIKTLIRGRDSTIKLQNLLCRKVNLDDHSVSADDLLMEILGSFSGGISMLDSSVSGEMHGSPASAHVGLSSPVDQLPEVHSRKKPAPAFKERRGCYKRRRTIDSSVKISATTEDGYAWRKYGQKVIHNSIYPRCYYRCTHKIAYGCKALKQVQKLEDDSNMYHITYLGQHNCPTALSNHEVVLNFEDFKNHQQLLNSPSVITNIHITPSVKQEVDSKNQSTDVSDIVSSANDDNSSPAIRWNDILMGDLGSCHEGASFMGFEHEDSCASTSSHGYLRVDDHFLNNEDFLSDFLV